MFPLDKILTLLLLAASAAQAQSPFLRGTDTRTLLPEAVMKNRQKWGLDLDYGGRFNRGNANINQVNTGISVFAAKGRSTAYLNGSMIYFTFNGKRNLNQGAVTARYDYTLGGPWKLFAFNTHGYNEFIRLDYRSTTGTGPWYDLPLGPSTHGLSLALIHKYEKFSNGRVTRTGRLSFRDVSKFPLSRAADLTAGIFWVPKLDEWSDSHLYAEIALETMVWKDKFGLKVAWIDEYDSRPEPGVKRNDSMWLTSLTLRFGE